MAKGFFAFLAALVILFGPATSPVMAAKPNQDGVKGAVVNTNQPSRAYTGSNTAGSGWNTPPITEVPDHTYPLGYSPTGNLATPLLTFDRAVSKKRHIAVDVTVTNVGTATLGGPNVCLWLVWNGGGSYQRASWGCPEVYAAPGESQSFTLVLHDDEFQARYGTLYETGTVLELRSGRYKESWRGDIPEDASWQVQVTDIRELSNKRGPNR